ncbi:ubiquinol-cytochrome c reductase complex assembly factor 5 isoform X1 [Aquarana catesbeiana]|uniref:ubiquinol-cytochrome c reductase complex assembly factor 5 isoform X1 n=1 Tax=Aquarana catesbeiana TaxID=8400 RepID=UPI003CCA002B
MGSRSIIRTLLDSVPGKRRLGVYRFLPFFFVLGGAMEWFMINVRIGRETFSHILCARVTEFLRMHRSDAIPQQPMKMTTSGHPEDASEVPWIVEG